MGRSILTILRLWSGSTPHIAGTVGEKTARKLNQPAVFCSLGLHFKVHVLTYDLWGAFSHRKKRSQTHKCINLKQKEHMRLHHVGIPPVWVFLRFSRQNSLSCETESTCIYSVQNPVMVTTTFRLMKDKCTRMSVFLGTWETFISSHFFPLFPSIFVVLAGKGTVCSSTYSGLRPRGRAHQRPHHLESGIAHMLADAVPST